jgi:hypothetical protein
VVYLSSVEFLSEKIPSTNLQITNNIQIQIFNDSKKFGTLLDWNLRFVCDLEFVICDLINFIFEKED